MVQQVCFKMQLIVLYVYIYIYILLAVLECLPILRKDTPVSDIPACTFILILVTAPCEV